MNPEKRLKEIEEQLKKSSAEIFKQKPDDIKKELEKEKTLDSPKNLIEPCEKKRIEMYSKVKPSPALP